MRQKFWIQICITVCSSLEKTYSSSRIYPKTLTVDKLLTSHPRRHVNGWACCVEPNVQVFSGKFLASFTLKSRIMAAEVIEVRSWHIDKSWYQKTFYCMTPLEDTFAYKKCTKTSLHRQIYYEGRPPCPLSRWGCVKDKLNILIA